MKAAEIYAEYFTHKWISDTGLGRLDMFPGDSQDAGNGKETVSNENGILYLMYFLVMAELAGISSKGYSGKLFETIRSLERLPGLYCRQPGNFVRSEAHDNYAAIAATSPIYGSPFSREILGYGVAHGFNYNNVEPDKYDVQQQRQGGEIAYYCVCAGYVPEVVNWIWLIGGLLLNAFKEKDYSSDKLTWLRVCAMKKADLPTLWQSLTFWPAIWIWQWKFKKKYQTVFGPFENHPDGYPTKEMARFVKWT